MLMHAQVPSAQTSAESILNQRRQRSMKVWYMRKVNCYNLNQWKRYPLYLFVVVAYMAY